MSLNAIFGLRKNAMPLDTRPLFWVYQNILDVVHIFEKVAYLEQDPTGVGFISFDFIPSKSLNVFDFGMKLYSVNENVHLSANHSSS